MRLDVNTYRLKLQNVIAIVAVYKFLSPESTLSMEGKIWNLSLLTVE